MPSYAGVNREVARRGQWVASEFKRRTGLALVLTSGYRDSAKQEELYERWRARAPGALPANPPGQSSHEWGLGLDYAVANVPYESTWGRQLYPLYWHIAQTAGFRVLGSRDPVHIEVPGWEQLVARYQAALQERLRAQRARDPGGNLTL